MRTGGKTIICFKINEVRTKSASKSGRRYCYPLDHFAFARLDFTTASFEAAGVAIAPAVVLFIPDVL